MVECLKWKFWPTVLRKYVTGLHHTTDYRYVNVMNLKQRQTERWTKKKEKFDTKYIHQWQNSVYGSILDTIWNTIHIVNIINESPNDLWSYIHMYI